MDSGYWALYMTDSRSQKSNPEEGCLSTLIESYPHIKALYVDNLLFCKDGKRLISGFSNEKRLPG